MARTVVVSGGGTGIGRAVARRFALAGDAVTIIGRRQRVLEAAASELNSEVGRQAVQPVAADLPGPTQVERAAAAIGPGDKVEVLVNNAGGGDAYSAAKAAIIGWTLDLAVRLGPDGVRVNAIVPGYVTDTEFFGDRMTPQRHQRLVARTLLGRAGTPEDVAGTAAFLTSDAAYITGQLLHVNGGAPPRPLVARFRRRLGRRRPRPGRGARRAGAG